MNSLLTLSNLLILYLLSTIQAQQDYEELTSDNEELMAELELSNLELQDDCENIANTYKSSLLSNTFKEKVTAQIEHNKILKSYSNKLKAFDEIPFEVQRNWEVLVKPGDAILDETDWKTLVSYEVGTDELIHTFKVHCKNETNCILVKRGYDDLIESSRNKTLLKKSWYAWQSLLSTRLNKYPTILNLINKAALQHGDDNAKLYWEKLQELENAYEVAEGLWDQIKPLYFKLQNFVKTRLLRFYNVTNSDHIPVYLLGSNFGDDWSNIANLILPHPHIYFSAEAYLNKTSIKQIYKMAEEVTKDLSLGTLGPKFWSMSHFDQPFCENRVISFCTEAYSELFTCGKTSWVSYLNAFESAIEVGLRNVNYFELPRLKLRYSAIDDAIIGLGSVFAIKNMRVKGVWGYELFQSDDVNVNEMTELLLTALRVLPKLPFYLTADKSRLDALQNGGYNMAATWWTLRRELQGVEGVFNNETDFLGDSYMTSNKPYLSRFFGTILQFQFLEHYKNDYQYPNHSIAASFGKDESFLTVLQERISIDWPTLINNFGLYEPSASPLLDYFAPLNDYLDSTIDLEQVYIPPATTTTPKPTSTEKRKNKPKKLIIEASNTSMEDEQSDEPEPEVPRHIIEDREETPNHVMEKLTVFIGVGLLAGVAALIGFVIAKKKMKRRQTTNRRFET